jgi:hypothetical protein
MHNHYKVIAFPYNPPEIKAFLGEVVSEFYVFDLRTSLPCRQAVGNEINRNWKI